MAGEEKLQDLKDQIDKSAEGTEGYNKIEIEEMEDFLKYPDNMENLGKAMEEDISPELKEEFTNAMRDLCKEIIDIKKKEITPIQFEILLFYIDYFCPEIETEILKKLEEKEALENDLHIMKEKSEELRKELNLRKAELNQLKDGINNLKQEIESITNGDNKGKEEDLANLKEKLKSLENAYKEKETIYDTKKNEHNTTIQNIETQENKIFKEYEEEFDKDLKAEDKIFYKVGIFVLKQRKKYIEIVERRQKKLEKREQEGKETTQKQRSRHQRKLEKNPFYRMLKHEERTQETEDQLDEMKIRSELDNIKNKISSIIDAAVEEYENDIKKVQNILNKKGELLSREEILTLYHFLYYYEGFKNTYTTKRGSEMQKYEVSNPGVIIPDDNMLLISSDLVHGFNIDNTLSRYLNLFEKRLGELGFSNDGIEGWRISQLYNQSEKDKDNGNTIRGIIRQKLLGEKKTDKDAGSYDSMAEEIDEKIRTNEIIYNALLDLETELSDPVKCLEDLQIDTKKAKTIKRNHLVKDIKKAEEVEKITVENIRDYIVIPDKIPQDDLEYITYNFKSIISIHLQLHPGWQSLIGDPDKPSTEISLNGIQETDKRELELLDEVNKLKEKSEDEQIKTLVDGLGEKYDQLDLWLKLTLSGLDEKNQGRIVNKLFENIGWNNGPNKNFLNACNKNTFIEKFKDRYELYWFKKLGEKALPYVVNNLSGRLLELRIGANIDKNTSKEKQEELLNKLFKNIGRDDAPNTIFFEICKKNKNNELFQSLKDSYELYWIRQGDKTLNWIIKELPGSVKELATYLAINTSNKSPEQQHKTIEKIFDQIPSNKGKDFIDACNKDKELKNLRDIYLQYYLQKRNAILGVKIKDEDTNKYTDKFFIDFSKGDFSSFYGKSCNITDGYTFDEAYENSKEIYNNPDLESIGIDSTIPLSEIINFLGERNECNTNIEKASDVCEREVKQASDDYNPEFMPVGGSPGAGHTYLAGEIHAAKVKFESERSKACRILEQKYVALLLQKKIKPTGKHKGISGANIDLDFSKDPGTGTYEERAKVIVRDTRKERLGDAWDEFVYNRNYDKKQAIGNVVGLITGIIASGLSCFSGNIWAAGAAFTFGSRLGNGFTQELLNSMQFMAEEYGILMIPGLPPIPLPEALKPEKATGGNAVKDPGVSFMLGFGAFEQRFDKDGNPIFDAQGRPTYKFKGWGKFLSELGFDYLGAVTMFKVFKELGPAFETIGSLKILPETIGKCKLPRLARLPVGVPLEFATKWLFIQNFGIDMPMNALHQGVDTFFGRGDMRIHGNAADIYDIDLGKKTEYEKYDIGDALMSMGASINEHLSFENQSQVLINTLLYCGVLECGQGIMRKSKNYMPKDRVRKYEESSKKFQEAKEKFVGEISKKGLELKEFEGGFKIIDKKTNQEIPENHEIFKVDSELNKSLKNLNSVLAEHTIVIKELVDSEKALSNNGSLTYGLLKRMGLLHNTKPPLRILEKNINELEARYAEALKHDDLKLAQELKGYIDMYESTKIVLITQVHAEAVENIKLTPEKRIEKAKELLGRDLKGEEEAAILEAHNAEGNPYYLTTEQIMHKGRILFGAGFKKGEVKILMDNCICGKMKGAESGKTILEREKENRGNEVTVEKGNKGSEDVRPEDVRPEDVKPEDVKPKDVKPEDVKPEDVRPEDVRPEDVRPEDVRPEDVKPEAPKAEAPKAEAPKADVKIETAEGIKGGKEHAKQDLETIRKHLTQQLNKLEQTKEVQKVREKIEEKMKELKEELEKPNPEIDIDFDPKNGTFKSFGGFEKFVENLINRRKTDVNFLNNIKLTIDFMTKKIINVGSGKKMTFNEWKNQLKIGERFINALEKHMINQWLDNPQYFCSHGFDHTVLVHSLITKIRDGLKLSADKMAEKYNLRAEDAQRLYNALIEISAILHDFGYPRQIRGDKTTHATSGAELFKKDLKSEFEEYLREEFNRKLPGDKKLSEDAIADLSCEMYNSICFHGADKVENHYVSRVEGVDNGRLYGGTLIPKSGAIKGESMDQYLDFQDYRISYKSEGFKKGVAGRYAGVYEGKLVVFESSNGTEWKIVEMEGKKGKVEPLIDKTKQKVVSENEVETSVREWQEISRTTAYEQAIELSKRWGGDIKIHIEGECVEFARVIEQEKYKKMEGGVEKDAVRDIVKFKRKGKNGEILNEYAEDFMKGKNILKIEGKGKDGKTHNIELNAENHVALNEQILSTAKGWSRNLAILTDKGEVKYTYDENGGKYTHDGKVISEETLKNDYKIATIEVPGGKGKKISVNDNAYEGRILNEDGKDGGAGLEYRSRDITDRPVMSGIRGADNLDMAFNRLIPSQSNAIFLTTLYNLENGSQLAKFFQRMENYNKKVNDKIKDRKKELGVEKLSADETKKIVDSFSEDLSRIREYGFGRSYGIDFYKILEEKGAEIDRKDKDPGEQREYRGADGSGFTFEFDGENGYYNGTTFDLTKFKQTLYDHVRSSGQIGTKAGEDILNMSRDLMGESIIGSYSVRHMVGLRSIVDVEFDGSVKIIVDMDTHFNSDISFRMFKEKNVPLRLVEYHLWREGTALDAIPYHGENIKSYIVDGERNIIGEIDGEGKVDYSNMFEEFTVTRDRQGNIDYSKGIIKKRYEKYKDSDLFKNRTGDEPTKN